MKYRDRVRESQGDGQPGSDGAKSAKPLRNNSPDVGESTCVNAHSGELESTNSPSISELQAMWELVKAKLLAGDHDPNDGMFWAASRKSDEHLKRGRQRHPSKQWRCCRCGAGFTLPISPEKVPVPWWYYEAMEAAGWKHTTKNPVPWSCPECGTCSYTVPE